MMNTEADLMLVILVFVSVIRVELIHIRSFLDCLFWGDGL